MDVQTLHRASEFIEEFGDTNYSILLRMSVKYKSGINTVLF